jgi:tetratricopeptide (TPR) repeat protein
MGTPAYMPPEQAGGEIDKLDERADVFGLGAVLCVILTGEPPYVADSGEAVRLMAVRGQLEAAFARLDACAADADLVVLCKRCLAADRDARPRHAGVVTVELAAHLAGIEERVHRAELERAAAEARAVEEANTRRVAEEKTTEERKRRRVQLALAASLLLLIGLVGLGAWWRERAEGDRKAEQARVEAERTAIESRLRLNVESAVGLAADLRKKYRFAEARTALDQAAGLIPADGPDDLREQLRQAVGNLAFVRELDEIRMKCSIWVQEEGGQGHYDFASAPPAYRAAFLAWGIDVASGDAGVVAGRIRESSVKADLVAALDDWAVLERDATVRNRVLVVARLADPGVWLDRFRDPTVRADAAKVMVLAEEADPAALSPGTVTALAELMRAHRLDPTRLLLAAQFTHPADFLISYTAGQWFYMKKDMKEAVAHFRAARVTRPDNLAILINMGSALRDQGDLKGAASSFREAVRLDPTFGKAHHNLGNILRKEKNWDGAVASFREAIRLDPKDAALRSTLGNTMKEKGDLDGAIALYKEAIAVDPKNATIHYNLGYALSFKPDMDGAASCFAEAIRLNPDYAEAHNNLGLTRKLQGDFDGAAASFRTAIRLKPRLANAHTNLGNVLKDKGDITGALASYQEAIRADPSDAIAHNNLGIVFLERKDLVGAIELSRTSIRLDPNYGPAHNSLGIALTRMGDLDGAIAAFTEAIRLEPKNPEYHINLGIALGIKGDIKGAPVPLREAVRLDPKNARAHSLLGGILRQAKDLDGAIASYQESIRLRPTNIDAHRNLGMTLALHGRPGEALRVTTDALRANRAWADDPRNFLRYNAACFAMNCADGKGTDAPPPGERPAYRRRALDYLTADLAATRKLAAAEPSLVHRRLKDWLADPDLVSIRERAELEKLPIDERVGWVKLWTEVRELRDETAPAELAPPPRPVKR